MVASNFGDQYLAVLELESLQQGLMLVEMRSESEGCL
jgi:hypothetical protein